MKTTTAHTMTIEARANQPEWAGLPVPVRCSYLTKLRHILAKECDVISHLIAEECNKHPLDALAGDIFVTLEYLRFVERNAPRILRPRALSKPRFFFSGTQFELRYEPYGVVLIFAPSNYPLQLSLVPAVTALATGNAVILKLSDRTPRTSALLSQLFVKVGLPSGLVQICSVKPEEASAFVEGKPDFIFFTGSSCNGRTVAQQAAKHLIPGVFELGGKDASIVFADCDIQRAIEGITYGAFTNTGRLCVAVKRVYVEASIYADFLIRIRDRIKDLRIGCTGNECDFLPMPEIDRKHLRLQVEDALSRGAQLIWPQDLVEALDQPVVLANVSSASTLLTEESFGPVLCVGSFTSEDEAIQLANSNPFALSSSIWTKDRARADRVATQMSAGSCMINDVVRAIANPYMPFGGNGLSGYGRYRGPEGLLTFSRCKSIMKTYTHRTRERNWFPYRAHTMRQLSFLMRIRHDIAGFLRNTSQMFVACLLMIVLHPFLTAQEFSKTQLTVIAQLTSEAQGNLGYLVFASHNGFPDDRNRAVQHGFYSIPRGTTQMNFTLALSPGTYAIALYEDLNGNHRLDRNWIGIPKEPVGVSKNPSTHFGPPKFDDCSFLVTKQRMTIVIRLVRP
ncbi:aldehyde dehydrogenase family protein [Pseudacidobacterium ailaaui]|jgi:acyl-CoA reductase-like NAD-dependent aldehyde dehydrogenase/uncharacterized protein (DUF2141 family)|uniref:aldehyde dehydrogenase family protein n=1 Tax=Pseudacidobacterium ailaaui TaxID=1382359 RepID=UPI0009E05323|nr:aldehyde dehydrogenase family protein [Pseudacidobacterium ailaaui]